jgi:hypothetical protein
MLSKYLKRHENNLEFRAKQNIGEFKMPGLTGNVNKIRSALMRFTNHPHFGTAPDLRKSDVRKSVERDYPRDAAFASYQFYGSSL